MNKTSLAAWQKWVLVTGKISLTLAISWQVSVVVWQVVAPAPLLLQDPSKGEPVAALTMASASRYHLFGEVGAEPVAQAAPAVVDAPDTRLKLTLLGVTVATPDEASSAIIAASGRAGEFFRVGDPIQGRTTLSAVYKDKVILDTSGKLETLKFDETQARGADVSRVSGRNDSIGRAPSRRGRSSEDDDSSLTKRLTAVTSANEFVDVATSELESDAMGALSTMGLTPIGPGEGYRVSPGSPLRKFQLRPGDIVLSINDQPLGDPETDQPLLQDIRSAGSVRIEVQRGDNRFTVNHQLD